MQASRLVVRWRGTGRRLGLGRRWGFEAWSRSAQVTTGRAQALLPEHRAPWWCRAGCWSSHTEALQCPLRVCCWAPDAKHCPGGAAAEPCLRCSAAERCPCAASAARTLGMLASASSAVGQKAVDLPPISTYAPRWSTRTTVPCTCTSGEKQASQGRKAGARRDVLTSAASRRNATG